MNPAASAPVPGASLPKKKSKLKKRLLIGAVVLVAVLVGVSWYKSKHKVKDYAVTTEKAVVRTVTQTVTATGKIQPEIEVKISPEVYGEITQMPFREGAHVKKGELIVKIKPDLYQAQVDQQTAAVASARAAATTAQAKVEKAQSDMKQYEDLYRRKLVSDADYITYKTNLDAARAEHQSALSNVEQAEGLLSQARDALSKTVIYAPMDGTVSSRTSEVGERVVATGQFTGTEIMRVADLGSMEVQVDVNENDVPNVKVGDHALISIDAYPDRKFNGIVREIGSSAKNSGASGSGASTQASASSTQEVTNFLVKIRVADRDVQLKPGMSATADIETKTVPNVVVVPIQSVTVRGEGGLTADAMQKKEAKQSQERSGNELSVESEKDAARRAHETLQRVVFIRTDKTVKMQPVETGIADNTWIEIKSGVKAGDEVVSGTYAAISRKLKDGAVVHIEPPKPEKDDDEN